MLSSTGGGSCTPLCVAGLPGSELPRLVSRPLPAAAAAVEGEPAGLQGDAALLGTHSGLCGRVMCAVMTALGGGAPALLAALLVPPPPVEATAARKACCRLAAAAPCLLSMAAADVQLRFWRLTVQYLQVCIHAHTHVCHPPCVSVSMQHHCMAPAFAALPV
jgi:hypothetical protein